MKQKLLLFFTTLLVFSCKTEPTAVFAAKTKIGSISENQGMTTYEGFLYSDSTFYFPSDLLDFSTGTFSIRGDIVTFKTTGGARLIEGSQYRWDKTGNKLRNTEPADGEWYDFRFFE